MGVDEKKNVPSRSVAGSLGPPLSWVFRSQLGRASEGQLRPELEALLRRRVGLELYSRCEDHMIDFLMKELIERVPPKLENEALLKTAICHEITNFLRKELGRKRPPSAVKVMGDKAIRLWEWKIYEGLSDEHIVANATKLAMPESEARQVLAAIAKAKPRRREQIDGHLETAAQDEQESVLVDSQSPEQFWHSIEENIRADTLASLAAEYGDLGPALTALRRNPKYQLAFLVVQQHYLEGHPMATVARSLFSTEYKLKKAVEELFDQLRRFFE